MTLRTPLPGGRAGAGGRGAGDVPAERGLLGVAVSGPLVEMPLLGLRFPMVWPGCRCSGGLGVARIGRGFVDSRWCAAP